MAMTTKRAIISNIDFVACTSASTVLCYSWLIKLIIDNRRKRIRTLKLVMAVSIIIARVLTTPFAWILVAAKLLVYKPGGREDKLRFITSQSIWSSPNWNPKSWTLHRYTEPETLNKFETFKAWTPNPNTQNPNTPLRLAPSKRNPHTLQPCNP